MVLLMLILNLYDEGDSMFNRKNWCRTIVFLLIFPSSFSSMAKMETKTVQVSISGTVVANGSCSFQGGKSMEINFGNVYVDEIKAGTRKENINYTINCEGDAGGKTISMKLKGSAASFDSGVIKTDTAGLGIRFLKDGQKQAINAWFSINPASPPVIQAQLISDDKEKFDDGKAFSSTAMIEVNYI